MSSSRKSPLARQGTKQLRITATRNEGFAEPIQVRLLDNPPGVSTQGQVTIPADQQEVTLTATANAKAPLGTAQIVAIGTTNKDGSAYELASQVVNLEVVKPLVAVKFPKAKVTRGESAPLVVGLECQQEFTGVATAELVGLPAGVTAAAVTFTHGASELPFTIAATDKARLGRAGGLVCRITIQPDTEPIIQMLGTGQVRVDEPRITKPGG